MKNQRIIVYQVYCNLELVARKNTKVSALRLARNITAAGDVPSVHRSIYRRSRFIKFGRHPKAILAGLANFDLDYQFYWT